MNNINCKFNFVEQVSQPSYIENIIIFVITGRLSNQNVHKYIYNIVRIISHCRGHCGRATIIIITLFGTKYCIIYINKYCDFYDFVVHFSHISCDKIVI